jgi:hypothetical protein
VPRAPEFIRGVINLRGRIIPVLDLKRKLGLGAVAQHARLAHRGGQGARALIGLLVDGASQVLKVPLPSIESAPEEVVEIDQNFIRGVAKLERRLIILDRPAQGPARELREARGRRGVVTSARLLVALLPLVLPAATSQAAEVAVLKSSDSAAWRPRSTRCGARPPRTRSRSSTCAATRPRRTAWSPRSRARSRRWSRSGRWRSSRARDSARAAARLLHGPDPAKSGLAAAPTSPAWRCTRR